MNNKGFTLVELLAIIVIIAIVGGIAIANFTNIFTSVQDQVFETYEQSMIDASVQYIIDSSNVPKMVGTTQRPVKISLAYLVGDSKKVNEFDCGTGPSTSSCQNVPKGIAPYLDHFKNPESNDQCVNNSYVIAYVDPNASNNSDGKKDNNRNIKYNVCLKCSNYESKGCSSGCKVNYRNGVMTLSGC